MPRGLTLSRQHGVNPAIPLCYFCGEPKNEVILAGRLPGDAEAPHNAVWDKHPCDKCEAHMKQGIILISVQAGSDRDNPYRTGGWVVIKETAYARIFGPPPQRVAFVEDEAWDKLGLPRG
jgi:hypothetical protein